VAAEDEAEKLLFTAENATKKEVELVSREANKVSGSV
jgi:hypothetical protein